MTTFLKLTDKDDGTPFYVRAARVEAVYEVPGKKAGESSFGLGAAYVQVLSTPAHTGIRTFSGGNFYVTESAEDVVAELNRSGR